MPRPRKRRGSLAASVFFKAVLCLRIVVATRETSAESCRWTGAGQSCAALPKDVEDFEEEILHSQQFTLLQKALQYKGTDQILRAGTDVENEAGPAQASPATCASYGCSDSYKAQQACQCTPSCREHQNCCSDFDAQCGSPGGFTPKVMPCPDKESCLQIVDSFLDKQPRQGNGLLQTYGENSYSGGGGTCGWDCDLPAQCPGYKALHHCRFDTYDNALAAIYYTKRGRFSEAQRILDGFIELLYPGKEVEFNGQKVSYGAADGLPSGRWLTLLAAAYTPAKAKAGEYWGSTVTDGAVDVGNNAWAAMAFAHYAADSGKSCYAVVAYDILAAINAAHSPCEDFLKGFTARLPPFSKYYRSTEHNIDVYALAVMLNDDAARQRAGTFVHHMYGYSGDPQEKQVYSTGTDMMRRCDTGKTTNRIPVDVQTWNLLANADDIADRKRASMAFVLEPSTEGGFLEANQDLIGNRHGAGKGDAYVGLRFSTRGNGAQWENAASGVMSLIQYRSRFGEMANGKNISGEIDAIGQSLRGLLQRYGSVLASVLGGNSKAWEKHPGNAARDVDYPGGSDTGFGWTYLRYPHTAATAWTGFFLLQQADTRQPLSPHANPYAPPAGGVPDVRTASAAAGQCLGGGPSSPPPPSGPPAPPPTPELRDSCAQFGCSDNYVHGRPCQCTSSCHRYGNCCSDFSTTCSHSSTPAPHQSPQHSCTEYGCNAPYNRHNSCQCNSQCKRYGNCCADYDQHCAGASAGQSCAAFGCGDYRPHHPCQCTSSCRSYHNCCADYSSVCESQAVPPPHSSCSAHPRCAGLDGNCCPTDAGTWLGCCD